MLKGIVMDYTVNILWDSEANVWIALSDDIIGLALESESLDKLMKRVELAVPELLELNSQAPAKNLEFKCNLRRQLAYV